MTTHADTPDTQNRTEQYITSALTCVILLVCYWDTLAWMLIRYDNVDSYYSHGYLVPLISGYFVWTKRHELAAVEKAGTRYGLLLMVAALLLHIFGSAIYIFSISGFSLFFFVVGATLYLYGWQRTRQVWFPLSFLLFMFPLPLAILNAISFPLKIIVARLGVDFVALLGIPIFREGFNITIPAGNLLVGNPCSGLRSLIAFLALGAILAYMGHMSKRRKMLLFCSSLPIALVSNLVRVPILILVSHYYGTAAAAPDTWVHTGSGLLVFVIGFGLMLLFSSFLGEKS